MYGFPSQRHLIKVRPFLIRLEAAQGELIRALNENDSLAMIRGVDDTSFWVGRSIAEMISASEAGEQNLPLFKSGLHILLKAQMAIAKAKKWLPFKPLPKAQVEDPSTFISPNGRIIAPLGIKQSRIRGAQKGLHTMTSIPKGTIISPCRIKIADTGDFRQDWRTLPTAPMINHSPFPTMDVRRGIPPNLKNLEKAYPQISQASYFVANRDIYPDEELTTDYRDKGWAEHDYFTNLNFLPLNDWDRNVYHSIGVE